MSRNIYPQTPRESLIEGRKVVQDHKDAIVHRMEEGEEIPAGEQHIVSLQEDFLDRIEAILDN